MTLGNTPSAALTIMLQMIHNIPQPDFEQFVARQLEEDPNVEIQKGVAFVSCEEVCHGDEFMVTSTVEVRATGTQRRIHSRHVIGCDGARSQVRKSLGIESEGEDGCKWRGTSKKMATSNVSSC